MPRTGRPVLYCPHAKNESQQRQAVDLLCRTIWGYCLARENNKQPRDRWYSRRGRPHFFRFESLRRIARIDSVGIYCNSDFGRRGQKKDTHRHTHTRVSVTSADLACIAFPRTQSQTFNLKICDLRDDNFLCFVATRRIIWLWGRLTSTVASPPAALMHGAWICWWWQSSLLLR